jgi:hypothetical protein
MNRMNFYSTLQPLPAIVRCCRLEISRLHFLKFLYRPPAPIDREINQTTGQEIDSHVYQNLEQRPEQVMLRHRQKATKSVKHNLAWKY